ncbi:hypothetical protein BgiMline_011011 [Biomphalaria glabrata]|nr:hypothetical protein BgiMline_026973 [Biomphalaria glabrata]
MKVISWGSPPCTGQSGLGVTSVHRTEWSGGHLRAQDRVVWGSPPCTGQSGLGVTSVHRTEWSGGHLRAQDRVVWGSPPCTGQSGLDYNEQLKQNRRQDMSGQKTMK